MKYLSLCKTIVSAFCKKFFTNITNDHEKKFTKSNNQQRQCNTVGTLDRQAGYPPDVAHQQPYSANLEITWPAPLLQNSRQDLLQAIRTL